MNRFFRFRLIAPIISTLLLVFCWFLFAPSQIGGKTAYISVTGNSMEPLLHFGDMVVVRQADQYKIGDIVLYNYPQLGPVIHRIVDSKNNVYTMKGDNNTWVDGYYPTQNDIVGRYWFKASGLGVFLLQVKTPWIFALVIGILTLVLGVTMFRLPDQKNKSANKVYSDSLQGFGNRLSNWRDKYWYIIYGLAIISVILGIFAFLTPKLHNVESEIPYSQAGLFTYSGDTNTPVYDQNRVQSGDPIFTALTCNTKFAFDYQLSTVLPFTGSGTHEFAAVLSSANGWHRVIFSEPVTSFDGSLFHTEQIVDLCSIQALITQVEAATGIQRLQYTLTFTPNVIISGQTGNLPLADKFSPNLDFSVESQQIFLLKSSLENSDPLLPISEGTLKTSTIQPNSLNLLGLKLPVSTARTISVIGFTISLLGFLLASLVLKEAEKNNELLKARLLIGQIMVEAKQSPLIGNERIVDLATFEDLALIADRSGNVVIFHQQPVFVDYLVRLDEIVYRFRKMNLRHDMDSKNTTFINEISNAIQNGELRLLFQPRVSLQTGKITGVEALLRWQHPKRGLLVPTQFLAHAEGSSVIQLIDSWVLQTACAQIKLWHSTSKISFPLAINISSYQLKQPNFAELVQDALLDNLLNSNDLQVEISQDQLLLDSTVLMNLSRLKNMGILISIKSPNAVNLEGTENLSSVDQVKIPQELVKQVVQNEQARLNAQQMITIAHHKELNVVAIGIENDKQLGFFQQMKCDEAQGYFISPPMPAAELTDLIQRGGQLLEVPKKF